MDPTDFTFDFPEVSLPLGRGDPMERPSEYLAGPSYSSRVVEPHPSDTQTSPSSLGFHEMTISRIEQVIPRETALQVVNLFFDHASRLRAALARIDTL